MGGTGGAITAASSADGAAAGPFQVLLFSKTAAYHSASDTEYTWPFYGQLVGAYFLMPPAVQQASVHIETPDHPAAAGIPSPWVRTDEWYDFQSNPRPTVTVLATVDESTYTGGTMGADHPIAWFHPTGGGGRALYTATGHASAAYSEPLFRGHLLGALRWVAGR